MNVIYIKHGSVKEPRLDWTFKVRASELNIDPDEGWPDVVVIEDDSKVLQRVEQCTAYARYTDDAHWRRFIINRD